MARRAKKPRRTLDVQKGAPKSPYIQRSLPFFDILEEEQIVGLEAQVDWILQDVGIAFRDDPESIALWKDSGAKVEGDIVRAPADWIRDLCRKAPSQFTQLARNPNRSVTMGGNHQVFAPIYGAPFVRDLKKGRRYGDLEAFENLVRLTYMHPNLHHGGFVTCEPCDIPVSKRHLDMLYAHMTLSDKPHLGAITEMSRAQDSVDMAEIVFGKEVMDNNCVIMGNVNTNSPLLVDKVVTEAVRVYSSRPGHGCRAVYSLWCYGACIYCGVRCASHGRSDDGMCVRTISTPWCAICTRQFFVIDVFKIWCPHIWHARACCLNYAIAQLARRAGLPLRCGGSLTASKIEDAQAAYESADSMHSTMLAGANYVLHAAGWLEGGLCTGFEKLVMDADRLGSYQKILGEGLDTSEEAFAKDAYSEVEPGGHFLGCSHTMRNYQTAFYEPALSDSENVESWEESGSNDMRQNAYKRWNTMLKNYEEPPMDIALREELQAFVSKRKEELPDAWY